MQAAAVRAGEELDLARLALWGDSFAPVRRSGRLLHIPPTGHHAPPPGAMVKVKPCRCCATLTPLVVVARLPRGLRRECLSCLTKGNEPGSKPTSISIAALGVHQMRLVQ